MLLSGDSSHVVVGVSGGIAAYKAVNVVRLLKKTGLDVWVVPTANALRMVGAATWEAVSGHPVYTDPFDGAEDVAHVLLGSKAKAFLLVPATANVIGKLANGIADDMLSTTVLSATCPIMVAPAMHHQMWTNPAVKDNISRLKKRGIHFIGPVSGELTSGDSGIGRLAEPEEIVDSFLSLLNSLDDYSLRGKHVVVTAGGTREPLDPVRFLGNYSSGRQGVEIARAAYLAGAEVTLVDVNLEVPAPAGVNLVKAHTALELQEVLNNLFQDLDILVMTAAVADYRPAIVADSKLKKSQNHLSQIELIENPDILAGLGKLPRENKILVGFAAETAGGQLGIEYARKKILEKQTDILVYNQVGHGRGFGEVTNHVCILDSDGSIMVESSGSKQDLAKLIISNIACFKK
ncbi:bifunctional phosphopantothenoylcysteine decarboxylase/phosphopantothenate--cysteine ligase CoaBC [Actinomycetaceae bacterium TAE3-ERU4]|nr:bifunctional phosphopantothenoylcysteine decarboxylase/phosphopantothenate--cysteine ligase CoaBC [Actinomycetaceae bacterium TAE3-ERU4]